MKLKRLVAMAIAALLFGCQSAYVIKPLPTLGGTAGNAADINRSDVIAGWSETETGETHAVLWREGTVTDLGTLGGANSWASGINDAEVVVGMSQTADGAHHAFLWQNGAMIDLHDPAWPAGVDSTARAVTNSGVAAGTAGIDGALWRGPGAIDVIRCAGSGHGDAYDINESGQTVGWCHANDQAFLWQDGSLAILPHLGIDRTRAYGINDAGQVAGHAYDPATRLPAVVVWSGDAPPLTAGALGGNFCTAYDINNDGLAVGYGQKADGRTVPFYFHLSEGTLHELMNFGSGNAYAVNDRGVIVGKGVDAAGREKPVMWKWVRWRWPWAD
jgi:probable HAF family extracellular repeat protein